MLNWASGILDGVEAASSSAAEIAATARQQYSESTDRLGARIALHARFSTAERGWPQWAFDQLSPHLTGTVVEVGAGTGTLWAANRDRLPQQARLLLSDASPAMCRALTQLPIPAEVLRCDAQRLPLRDAVADLFVADHMLYHVPNSDRALAEAARVLRPGGIFAAATNGRQHMRQLEELTLALGIPWAGARLHLPFCLEDAPERIGRYFAGTDVRVYSGWLQVTEAEPVVDYIASVVTLDAGQRQRIRAAVEDRIAQDGAFRIDKSTGMILGRRATAGG